MADRTLAAIEGGRAERPRNDQGAERATLGAVLLEPSVLASVASLVRAGDFYHPAHAVIFECMLALNARGEPIDIVTLSAELQRRQRLNAVGGLQYLGELAEATPTTANATAHARLVADHAAAREVSSALRELQAALARGSSVDSVRGALAQALDRCSALRSTGPRSYEQLAGAYLDHIERLASTGRLPGVSTGLRELDDMLGGLQPGQLVVLGARPRMGKTAAAINIVESAAANDGPVLVVSLEMVSLELFGRSAAARGRIDGSRLRLGRISGQELAELYAACEGLRRLPIEVEDTPGLSLLDVATTAARVRAKYGSLSLIVIDYLQLLSPTSSAGTREQEVGEISRGLKRLAKSLGVPVLVLAQLNRACDIRTEHRPQLSDLRDSGAIEQDADATIFLYRDEVYNKDSADKGVAEFIVAKQRNGPEGTVRLAWEGRWMRFSDLDAQDELTDGGVE